MLRDLKVAAIQAKVPKNKTEGEAQIRKFVAEAVKKGVDLVGLPEDCVCPYAEIRAGYQPLDFLSATAQEFNINLFGATAVLESDGLHNRGFYFDRTGKLIHTHDKVILIPGEIKDGVIPGNTLEVFDTEFGKMAILVCKDSFHRYAAWFMDQLRRACAEIILVPSYSVGVGPHSIGLWVDSLKAVAKWFDLNIIAPGTIGPNSTEFPSFGHALIISRYQTLAEGSEDKEEILTAVFDHLDMPSVEKTFANPWQPSEEPKVKIIIK